MKTYRVEGVATVEVVTFVKADSEEEAQKKVIDRDLDLCIHGSEIHGYEDFEEFQLTDGTYHSIEHLSAEEHES